MRIGRSVSSAKLAAVENSDERSSTRFRLSLVGTAGQVGDGLLEVVLHDLSATGFLLESSAPLEVGTQVDLEMPGLGAARGEIIWGSSRFFGGQFRPALVAGSVQAALAQSRIVGADFARRTAADRSTRFEARDTAPAEASIPFNRPSLIGDEIECVRDAIRRGQLSGDGYYTKQCNARIQEITQSRSALITHSCTAALEMAAILCGLGPGDEAILPSFTFVSTANAIVMRGATPVFVDVDPRTLNIDPSRVEAAVTPRTKAIFAVHYAGFPADMDALQQIARAHGLLLIEDAAQALGSTYKGRRAGSLGDLAAFSFHETKNVISGEGGALTINRPDLVQRAEIIREKGTDRSRFLRGQVDKYTWVDLGSSYLPGELIASYLYAQLELEPVISQRRVSIYNRYMQAFGPLAEKGLAGLPVIPDDCTGNGHMFYLLMHSPEQRDAFIAHMKRHRIMTPFHYVPLHSAPAGRRFGRTAGPMTETDRVSGTLVRLPLFFDLGDELEEVINRVNDFFR